MKQSEAMRNDERMKLINDMITGIRTIKAYAWENHYSQKVRAQRAEQVKYVFWLNLIGSLGFSLFQNVGLLAILAIFLPKWYMGEKLALGDSFALVAMIYYLFFSVNGLTYYSMQTM
jgi:ABC-type bacteriocin/lantibiotic exporter with double-glycine peptidase domain